MSAKPVPKRTAEMWHHDLCASVEFLSESPDAQLARMEQRQIRLDATKRRFQLGEDSWR
jgi:hypothetical protein